MGSQMDRSLKKASPGEINGSHFDRFTLAHAAGGYILGKFPVSNFTAILFAIGWELIEDKLKYNLPNIFPNASLDTKENALTDSLVFLLAYHYSKQNLFQS